LSPIDPMRVAYVVKRYPRFSETFIVNEILAHEAAGWEIEIFSLRPPLDTHFQDRIARVRAPVQYLGVESKASALWRLIGECDLLLPELWANLQAYRSEQVQDVYQALLLARETKRRGIEHLHAHFASAATTVTRMAAQFAGLPYTFTAHAKDIFHEDVDPADLRRKVRDAAAVITVSEFNRRFLSEEYGAADRVRRIYNGLELDQFPYEAPHERPPHIVAVGRLVEKKGFADLVDACAILAERGREFQCRIIGGGELEADLQQHVERLKLGGRVVLMGPRPQAEVIRLVQSASVLAAPCIVGADGNRDGLPTVLLEAMALGTPCISTDVTGIPEVLRGDETGLLVPQHAPGQLADALEQLLSDAALRVRLASAARRLIAAEFDIHKNAARLQAVFQAAGTPPAAAGARQLQEAV
jgi:colanic acid/amylovoran biosynthesis glycosyltransferase